MKIRIIRAIALSVVSVCLTGGALAMFEKGEWEKPKIEKWQTAGAYARIEGSTLIADVPAGLPKTPDCAWAKTTIDLTEYDGQGFELEIDASDADVDVAKNIKFMVSFTDQLYGARWYVEPKREETKFDRKHYINGAYTGAYRGKCSLVVGLQLAIGSKIKFDLDSLRIRKITLQKNPVKPGFKCEYTERVRNIPQLKGMMLSINFVKEDDIKTLAKWGGRLARYQICMEWKGRTKELVGKSDRERWWALFEKHLANLDETAKWCRKYGVMLQIDMHGTPGGRYTAEDSPDPTIVYDMKMFWEKDFAKDYIKAWQMLASRFKGNEVVYGYDLVNEPEGKLRADTKTTYWDLQDLAIKRIREIDPDTPIIVSPNYGGGPVGFKHLLPFPYKDIIYQVHFYRPHDYTLQGWMRPVLPERYPTEGTELCFDWLNREIESTVKFQKLYGARINCGEWSCVSWAKGVENYMADCIKIFDEYGWDWAYGALREWQAWSLEHEHEWCGPDGKEHRWIPSEDNPRKQVMLKAFSKQEGKLPWQK